MAKRRISAKGVISDLRSGLDNARLMEKHSLSPSGLQSLFDKLLTSGAIDLAEIRDRMPGKWGTIPIREAKVLRLINVQEAARDLRSGMTDAAFMGKYGLSFDGLQLLFDKLLDMGAIRQLDLDERRFSSLNRVDLDDDTVDLSTVIEQMFGRQSQKPSRTEGNNPAQAEAPKTPQQNPLPTPPSNGKRAPLETGRNLRPSGNGHGKAPNQKRTDLQPAETPWYDKPLLVLALLIGVFPLGFHALFRNKTLSSRTKGCVVAGWVLLVAISLKLLLDFT